MRVKRRQIRRTPPRTGGVAALLIDRLRDKKGVKRMVGVGRSEWTQTKEKES